MTTENSNTKGITAEELERKQLRIAFEKVATMASEMKALVNMVFEHESDIHRTAKILGAIEVMAEQTGIIADQWAGRLDGSCILDGVEAWTMPPTYHASWYADQGVQA